VIERARKSFASDSGTAAEQRTALAIVAAHADAATFDALVERARKTADPLQKQQVFAALAGVTDLELARRMVDIALSDQIPAGGSPEIIEALALRHPQLVWKAVAPRLDEPALHLDKSDRWRLAASMAGYSADPQRIADLDAYVARSVPAEARRPFLAAAASIRQNALYATKVLPEIDGWIRSHGTSR
jgi:aminopeptidase N